MKEIGYLGIDVGSISTNMAVLEPDGEVITTQYLRGGGHPIRSVQEGLRKIRDELPDKLEIGGVCTTGSGRNLIGAVVGADIVKNEIMAHARAALELHPDVRTIFEIGGQDSKVTVVRDGVVVDFAMNLVCAAGTGSFLDSQARRLEITTERLSELAILSDNPTDIAGRCTVFAESDMIHKQQIGHAQNDILMGLCHALVRNYLNNVCRGQELRPPYVLQGGVSANEGIRRALKKALDSEIIIPRYNMVMGAYGAALIAARAAIAATRFRGYVISERDVVTRSFDCEDCPNNCEIIEIADQGEIIGNCGGRCGKWEGRKKVPDRAAMEACPLESCGQVASEG
jgi:predicted CoA-substrate-specific enzyme activase